MNPSITAHVITAGCALLGAAIGATAAYFAARIRYEALVEGAYKREWVADLRNAVSELLGRTELFVSGYVYSEFSGRERIKIINELNTAKKRVQVLLDSEVEEQQEVRNLCQTLAHNLSSPRRIDEEDALEKIGEIAQKTESIARKELRKVDIG
jgi:predicted transcriptional regulator